MRTTIDAAGRIVVPKDMRDRLRLTGGAEVEVVERGGAIEITPAPARVEIVDTPEGPVAAALDDLPPLTDADVRDVIDAGRR